MFDSPYQCTEAENTTPPNLWEERWKLISDCAQQDYTSDIDLWPHDVQPRDAREIPVPVDAGAAPDAADGGGERVIHCEPLIPGVPDSPVIANQPLRRSERNREQPDRMGATAYDANHPLRGEDLVTAPWWPHYPRPPQ